MSDLQRYIDARKNQDKEFTEDFETGYVDFKIGVLLRQMREAAGLTREQVALQIGTKKSAISRIENHAESITLATLTAFAQSVGHDLRIELIPADRSCG